MYAIVDIETTGGNTENEAITEIAIYKYDGNQLVDQFISLVNPQRPIQPFVQKLTGINNKMLRKAPKFYEIAKRIIEITKNCTIVAHNASFDYRILKKEFKRLGYDYERPRLCTVKLSKEYIPGMKSYSLGNLCKNLHIPISNRHRASGDALATVELFKIILNKKRDLSNRIENDNPLNNFNNLDKDIIKMITDLPEKKGVLYLYNEINNLVAVYSTKNIQKRLRQIFLKNNQKNINLQHQLKRIDYELIKGNLINKLIAWHNRYIFNPHFTPCSKKKYQSEISFDKNNFIILDKGHHIGENAIILVENNKVIGYGFYKLNWEKQNLELIKKRLTPINNHPFVRQIISDYINNNKRIEILEL